MIHMIEVAQGVLLMQHSPAFGKGELMTIKDWFSAYLEWITTHPYGQDAMEARNNHGTCWVMQVAAFARLAEDEELLEFCRRRSKEVLLPGQMADDGSFLLELERTNPYCYYIFNLYAIPTTSPLMSVPDY